MFKSFLLNLRLLLCVSLLLGVRCAIAQEGKDELPEDLTEIDLKKLMDLDLVVTSPGKKEQALSNVASAVYVITAEEIHRSGATHIAEVLRGAPGVSVARIASNRWAVSIRGFNQLFSNKLLVLIDGVSVFSPTTNGVYWEATDLPLSTIERIEVVRGPGGVLWGSNAVNGIINIITKSSTADPGLRVSAGGGSHEQGFAEVVYSQAIDDSSSFRTFSTFKNRGKNESVTEESALDNWQDGSAGFRADKQLNEKDSLMFSGDFSQQWENVQVAVPSEFPPFVDKTTFADDAAWRGVKALGKWHRQIDSQSDLEAKLSFVHKDRNQDFVSFNYEAYTAEIQHRFQPLERHDLVYGGSYRFFQNSAQGSFDHEVDPGDRNTNLINAFLQDEITITPDLLKLILGTKVEYQSLTGTELMPNARLLLTPNKTLTLWSAVSRAVAPPAIFFEDTSIPVAAFPLPDSNQLGVVQVNGNRDLDAESLVAYEMGARSDFGENLYVDIAGFYNEYDNIFGQEPGAPYPGVFPGTNTSALVLPYDFANTLKGSSYGGELSVHWKPHRSVSIVSSYSYLYTDIDLNGGVDINNQALFEGGTPSNQVQVRSYFDLTEEWSLDTSVRYVDWVAFREVDPYFEMDARIAWLPCKNLELSVVGQNLLQQDHVEFESNLFGPPRTAIERGYYGMVTWKFN